MDIPKGKDLKIDGDAGNMRGMFISRYLSR